MSSSRALVVLFLSILFLTPVALDNVFAIQTAYAAGRTKSVARAGAVEKLSDPTRLQIPSIELDVPVEAVGINAKGEMDVPDASSAAVGWYKYGVVPGAVGSAVIDAHVFAAFSNLKKLAVGSDIYVTEGTVVKHFTVQEAITYRLSDISPQYLFARSDARRLNLITCAGTFVPALGTYDHRLVVYAVES